MNAATAAPLESFAEKREYRLMTISHAVDLWLGELTRKNLSARTIDTYRRLLNKLADSFPLVDVGELTSTQVRRFLDGQALRQDGGGRKSAATVAQNVSIINGLLDWLTWEAVIDRNPVRRNGQRILSRPKQVAAADNDNVTTISGSDVGRLLEAARGWEERLAVNLLAYCGPRRRALAVARLADYDQAARTLTFREKGARTIAKPVPHKLADLLDAAVAAGVYTDALAAGRGDYLVPSRAVQRRGGERDDRVIWNLVRDVAGRAGVKTHVHALRAAFAVEYLETHPGQVESLKDLMGHRRIETTLVYLRRLDRKQKMESVRDLDYGRNGESEIRTRATGLPMERLSRAPLSATQPSPQNKQFARKPLESLSDHEPVNLQPSFDADALLDSVRRERGGVAPHMEE